jgi:AbrB family looped-hinge helix DNA binding protein
VLRDARAERRIDYTSTDSAVSIRSRDPTMETTTLSTKYQLVLPKGIREPMGLKPGQRFPVRASEHRIELIPCEPLSRLRAFLSGADTGMDDIRECDEPT